MNRLLDRLFKQHGSNREAAKQPDGWDFTPINVNWNIFRCEPIFLVPEKSLAKM